MATDEFISYLKVWKKDLGILVNFGLPDVNIERIPFTEKELIIAEDFSEVTHLINSKNRKYLVDLRDALHTIFDMYGLGYTAPIYKALLQAELSFKKTPFSPQIIIPLAYEGQFIRDFTLNSPTVADNILSITISGQKDIESDILRMKTYLNSTNYTIGILIHFGKEKLEIIGISA